ncbi:hypothetical protein [Nocardia abscessus]|nr:hypothetical protein [Nocardia abscessus]
MTYVTMLQLAAMELELRVAGLSVLRHRQRPQPEPATHDAARPLTLD